MTEKDLSVLRQLPSSTTAQKSTCAKILGSAAFDQLEDIITSGGKLFAYDTLWKPMLSNKQGLEKALGKSDLILLSKPNSNNNQSEIVAFSLTFKCDVKIGLMVDFWFYTKMRQPEILASHLAISLKNLATECDRNKSMALNILVPPSYDNDMMEELLRPFASGMNDEPVIESSMIAGYTETHAHDMEG